MGLMELASGKSLWRGFEYYEERKVILCEEVEEGCYRGNVTGRGAEPYMVYIDKKHPRKSSCNCPLAKDSRVICKHMIALLFTAKPEEAENYLKRVEECEVQEEEWERQHYEELENYVRSLSKAQLQQELFNALLQLEEQKNFY